MCGRFAQFNPVDILRDDFDINYESCDVEASYNISPSNKVLCVINHEGNRLGKLSWGLIPSWAKDSKKIKGLINARAETISEKPSFKESFLKRRCLIIADGFYEWKQKGTEKQPYYFYLPDKKPFAFAGLWDTWKSDNSDRIDSCTIITKKGEGVISEIHHRMPVILRHENADVWLDENADPATLKNIINNISESNLAFHKVHPDVNDVRCNSPKCIAEI